MEILEIYDFYFVFSLERLDKATLFFGLLLDLIILLGAIKLDEVVVTLNS